jgi:UDP-N-acetylmuramate--alanine ligase
LLLANADGENNQEVAKAAKCPVYWYGDSTSETRKSDKPNDVGGELANPPLAEEGENRFDFYAADQTFSERGSSFTFHEADNSFPINLPLLGWHNVANAVAAIAMARLHRIEPGMIQAALANFPGFYRRLECRTNFNGTKIYHDQAQLPVKIKGAMDALRLHYPRHHIVAVLDPHASVLHHPQSLKQYTGIFSTTNQVIVSKMKIRKLHKDESKHDRVTGQKIVKAIAQTQPQVSYQPLDKVLIDQLINLARPDTIIIFLSTGGLRGIIEQVIDKITTN